jgi:hypothetical protein
MMVQRCSLLGNTTGASSSYDGSKIVLKPQQQ